MFEETGSTSARIPAPPEAIDPRDAEIERLKSQLLEVREYNSEQISSLIRQNELLTVLNCNLTNENKEMSQKLATTSKDCANISKDCKLIQVELRQTKEMA